MALNIARIAARPWNDNYQATILVNQIPFKKSELVPYVEARRRALTINSA
jgi:hypothetical protein